MMCPEKGAPERLYGACGLKDLAGHGRVSEKEFLSGRKRAAAKPRPGTRTALYMRVSTADQKPDLQYDDLHGYAARASTLSRTTATLPSQAAGRVAPSSRP